MSNDEFTESPAMEVRLRKRADVGAFSIVAALAVAAWIVFAIAAIAKYASYRDTIENTRSISAPQISQISDELLVELVPFGAVAVMLTVIALMVGLRHVLLQITAEG